MKKISVKNILKKKGVSPITCLTISLKNLSPPKESMKKEVKTYPPSTSLYLLLLVPVPIPLTPSSGSLVP